MVQYLAPNGKPSNLNPEQYKLVRTPAFKKWFGDWENDPANASKVVDENGEPLVVYHGTNAEFWKFDKSKGKGNIKQKSINFSSNKEVAKNYGNRIITCFLNLKNPLIKNYNGENYHTITFDARFENRIKDIPDVIVNQTQSEKKYDGVIFLNIQDSKSAYDKFSVPIANNYYAFNNNQIKLADGSNTTFDGSNPDIRFEEGGLIAPNGKPSNLNPEQYKLVRTKAFKDWFGDWENSPETASKVVDENGEPLVCNHSSREENIDIFYGGRIFRTKKNEVKPIWFTYKQFNEYASGDDIFQYQCFLNIKNLFDYSKIEDVNILKKSYIEKNGEMLPDYDFDMDWDAQEQFNLPAYIYEMGYDGYKFTDEYSIVVFNSNQIKLADGSNTTFDGSNPDIRFEEGGLIAPNGKPSNLTPEQYKLVRTPEFKAWFGDWENSPETSSKVVDENGEPKVSYHGSSGYYDGTMTRWGTKFTKFSTNRLIFATNNYKVAEHFGDVGEYFINIKNPFILDGNTNLHSWDRLDETELIKKIGEDYFIKFVNEYFKEDFSNIDEYWQSEYDFEPILIDIDSFGYYVKKNFNYDGIIAYKIYETPAHIEADDYISFEPYQIKLADGSNTTFDGNNPDIRYAGGGIIQPRDLTHIDNYRNIYKGAEFYTFSDNNEKVEKADRWFELFRTNQKERQLTTQEFSEFMKLSSELSWEEFSNGGGVEWDSERYREVEKEMFELRQQGKGDTPEYFKLIKERGILEKSKLKKTQNKDMETGHSDINTTYAKGGKIVSYKTESAKFKRIGIEDKYIIEAINEIGLQGINFDEKTISKKIESEFEELLDSYQSYLISEDSQSITNEMNNEIETKKEEGASLEVIDKMEKAVGNVEERQKKINDIAKTQLEVISIWVDYLKSSEYRVAFKYLILKAVLNYNYDLKQNKLIQRNNEIIRNFTPFDAGSLAELHEMESDYLLEDYIKIMNENSQKVLNSRDVIEESIDGKWLKFNGGNKTNEKDRDVNAKELMQLVQNTYWCTKTNANSQLRGGDFYVYVTEKEGEIFPRIAVRMNGNEVGEVRGNRSSAQDLEDDTLPIAQDFLIKNIPNNSGRKWLNSIRYNKRCRDLRKRMESEGLFKDFIYEYIEIVADASKYNVDYGGNGNVALLKEVFNQKLNSLPNGYYKQGDIVTEISKLTKETLYYIGNLDPYDISKLSLDYGVNMDLNTWKLKLISGNFQPSPSITTLGNLEMIGGNFTCNEELNDLGSLKYIGGFINFSINNKITSLENIEYIGKTLIIDNSKQNIKNLGKLKKINGSLNLINCDETFDVGDLEYITENLTLTQSNIDFKNIKKIDGSLNLKGSLVNDLKMLEYVGGSLDISNSKVKIFQNLKFIGGDVDFSNNFSSSTQSIETILGSVKFLNSRIVEFPNLKKIGGDIDFRGSFFKTFGNIKYIGGNINLAESKVEELGNLEYVGGYVNFRGTKIESLNKLKKIVSFVNFEGSNVSDLGDLESIGGNAYFIKTKIKSLGKLKYIGGIAQFDRDTTLEKEWNKRKNG